MINIEQIKAGRIATVLMEGEYKLNKGGRSGTPINEYYGRVTRKFRFTITLAGEETYYNINPDAVGKPSWFEFVKDGLVRHKTNGQLYLAGIPTNNTNNKYELYVDGRPITKEEYEAIQQYRSDSKDLKFLTVSIDNCTNVEEFEMYGVK
jgi:hypothetical protein